MKTKADKGKWVRTATEKKKLREELQGDVCPICGKPFDEGMLKAVLDHDHDTGEIRGVIHANCNLFEGRVRKYFRKILGPDADYAGILSHLSEYILESKEVSKELPLHYGIVEMEERRVRRWRKETIYSKLLTSNLVDKPIAIYTKDDLILIWINNFIVEVERQ